MERDRLLEWGESGDEPLTADQEGNELTVLSRQRAGAVGLQGLSSARSAKRPVCRAKALRFQEEITWGIPEFPVAACTDARGVLLALSIISLNEAGNTHEGMNMEENHNVL